VKLEKIKWFISRARNAREYALHEDTSALDTLKHLNLLEKEVPSNASILLFGKSPQRFLITSEVKCLHFHGTEIQKPIPSYQIYKGTVFDLVDQSVDFVMSKLARSVGTREQGPEAPVEYDIPQAVVAEGIVNAIAHKDYTSNASVQIMLFADRLEIWNPGGLPPSLSLESLRKPHASHPANPLIAEPLFLAKYIEKAGTGTLDMIQLCRKHDLMEPEFRLDDGSFVLILRRKDAGEVTTEVTTEVILANTIIGEMTRKELQDALSLKNSEHFRKHYLLPALESGIIEMTIPDKPTSRMQKYRLTEKGRGLKRQK
jgi:predicted HTH transcriptional regulator